MEIIWRRAALNDIRSIHEFIAQDRVIDEQVRILAVIHTAVAEAVLRDPSIGYERGGTSRKGVGVQVPSPAPNFKTPRGGVGRPKRRRRAGVPFTRPRR